MQHQTATTHASTVTVVFIVSYILHEGTTSTVLDPSLYSVSLQSSTSYIATINVSDSVLYGEWQLNLTVYSGPYTVRIAAVTDLTFEYTLYRFDPSSNYGFTTVEGNPQQGKLHLISLYTYSSALAFDCC